MKRLICLFAAVMMAVPQILAVEKTVDLKEESKTYKLDSFDALDVSWIYKVRLTQSRNQSVKIEAPDFVMPYLDVRVRKGCLILGMENMPTNIRRKLETGKYEVRAYVSMKKLSRLEMSGASKLEAEGEEFQCDNDSFVLNMSGATHVNNLTVSAKRSDIDCSGASKFQLEGKIKEVKMDLSGASKGTLKTDTKKMDMDLSGAAKINVYGNHEKVRVLAASAISLEMDGTMEQLTLTGSGAAKVDLLDCPVLWATINLSGASSAKVDVKESLGVRLSGASGCQYRAGDNLQITETDVSRGSTLRKL